MNPPLGAPSASAAVNSTDSGDAEAATKETVEPEDRESEAKWCDYSVGKWVLDEATRPLYSGLECKKWLATAFACRLHDHPDKLMDRYRWQPAGCDLPVFNASRVLEMYAFLSESLLIHGCCEHRIV